jgi:hypothetical protein
MVERMEEMRMRNEIHTARRMSSPSCTVVRKQASSLLRRIEIVGDTRQRPKKNPQRQRQNARFPLRSSHVRPTPWISIRHQLSMARAKKKMACTVDHFFAVPFHFIFIRNLPAVPYFSFCFFFGNNGEALALAGRDSSRLAP